MYAQKTLDTRFDVHVRIYINLFYSLWKCVVPPVKWHVYISAPVGPLVALTGYVGKGSLNQFQIDSQQNRLYW